MTFTETMSIRIKEKARVLVLGDSIVEGLARYPDVLDLLKPFNAVNCGIRGDSNQNLFWRVDHFPFQFPFALLFCCVVLTISSMMSQRTLQFVCCANLNGNPKSKIMIQTYCLWDIVCFFQLSTIGIAGTQPFIQG